MDLPPIHYARTSDGINVAFLDLGQGPPIVFTSNIYGDAHGYRLGLPHVRILTDDLAEYLPRLALPTLVIHEPSFPYGSLELCREVAVRIRDAQFAIVDGRLIAGEVRGYVDAIAHFLGSYVFRGGEGRHLRGQDAALTPRELDVRLIAAGRTNREIAVSLVLSERTIARHITNIYAKIAARSKADATAYAIHHGLA